MSNPSKNSDFKIPNEKQLKKLLAMKASKNIGILLSHSLISPILDLMNRPKKNFRSQLVNLGFCFASESNLKKNIPANPSLLEDLGEIIEAIHAGSLIVDDIQDNGKIRRGKPALHVLYGTAVALNAGNWLYFWPLQKIRELKLEERIELSLYQLCNSTLLRAHFGQALDVGTPIDQVPQHKVQEICLSTLELKSGALMALALKLGAVVGGATEARLKELNHFGNRFGSALQMFDDMGNLKGVHHGAYNYNTRFEDLYLRRPTWIWSVASQNYSNKDYKNFVRAVQALPDETKLTAWIQTHELIPLSKKTATIELQSTLKEFYKKNLKGIQANPLQNSGWIQLSELTEKLVGAYE